MEQFYTAELLVGADTIQACTADRLSSLSKKGASATEALT